MRLMRFFEIDVAECNLKPSMKCFKTFGIQKMLLAHTILIFFHENCYLQSLRVENDT